MLGMAAVFKYFISFVYKLSVKYYLKKNEHIWDRFIFSLLNLVKYKIR